VAHLSVTAVYIQLENVCDPKWTSITTLDSGIDLVDQFCYLGEMLSTDGGADAAVIARTWSG